MLWCAKAKCVSRARQTCELMFMSMSIWMEQEAEGGLVVGQGKVGGLRSHVGLLVDDGGHCIELKVKLVGLCRAEVLSRLL